MRKFLLIILLLCLTSCFLKKDKEEETQEEVVYYSQDELNITYDKDGNFDNEEEKKEDEVDLDLLFMSSTAKYAEVYNMLLTPEEYEGKTIRIGGLFSTGEDYNGNMIFGCIVPDATACCANGIQFFWKGEHSYPEDYPQLGDQITVQGTFGYDKTDDYLMIYLDEADLQFNSLFN